MHSFYKVTLIILLSFCFFSFLLGEDEESQVLRNAVAIDPFVIGSSGAALGIGVSYEYGIADQFSIIATVNYSLFGSDTNGNISNISVIGYGIRGRLYTYGAAVEGAFIGLGAAYEQVTFNLYDGTSNPATWILIPVELGYKFIFYNFMNVYAEPCIGYDFFIPINGYNVNKGGGYGILDLRLGVAF